MTRHRCAFISRASITVLAILLVPLSASFGQWTRTSGPAGADVRTLLISDALILAGCGGGEIYRSTDLGNTWMLAEGNGGLVWKILNSPPDFFAATTSGVLKSSDDGATWVSKSNGLPAYRQVHSIIQQGSYLFAGTEGGICRSSDFGETWTLVNNGLTGTARYVFDLTFIGDTLFAATNGTGCIYVSGDAGDHWTSRPTGLAYRIECFEIHGTTVYGGTLMGGGLYATTNNGQIWQAKNNGLAGASILDIELSGTKMYVATSFGAFVSSDYGESWSPINTLAGDPAGLSSLWAIEAKGAFLVAGSGSTMFVSTNWGALWNESANGLKSIAVLSLAQQGRVVFAGTWPGVFVSSDYGVSWRRSNNGRLGIGVCFLENGDEVFSGGNRGIFVTTDSGASWQARNDGLTSVSIQSMAKGGGYFFACSDSSVYRSSDDDHHWTKVSTGLWNTVLSSLTYNDTFLYVSSASAPVDGIFRSANNGVNWTNVFGSIMPDVSVYSLASRNNKVYAGTDYGLWRTANNGESWEMLPSGTPPKQIFTVLSNGNALYSSSTYGYVSISESFDSNWTDLSSGFPPYLMTGLVGVDSLVFAGTGKSAGVGVWTRPLDQVLAPEKPEAVSAVLQEGSSALLTWHQSTAADLLRYRIWMFTSLTPATVIDSSTDGPSDTTIQISGLLLTAPGRLAKASSSTYFFCITAVDSALHESAPSDTLTVTIGCCNSLTGNIDCDPLDGVDIGDLTVLIDNLFISFTPLCCETEANCDGTGGVDIGDVTALIDNLFITFTPLAACQ